MCFCVTYKLIKAFTFLNGLKTKQNQYLSPNKQKLHEIAILGLEHSYVAHGRFHPMRTELKSCDTDPMTHKKFKNLLSGPLQQMFALLWAQFLNASEHLETIRKLMLETDNSIEKQHCEVIVSPQPIFNKCFSPFGSEQDYRVFQLQHLHSEGQSSSLYGAAFSVTQPPTYILFTF